jgi:hypothetical protein
MTLRPPLLAFAAAVALLGCQPPAAQPTSSGPLEVKWGPGVASSDIHLQVESLGQISHSQLQLPVVSPDGQWVACFQSVGPVPPRESLFAGKGLEGVSLSVQRLAGASPSGGASPGSAEASRMVCPSGAAWAAWSSDARTLVFSALTPEGGCELKTFNVASGAASRLSVDGKRAIMSAVSPSGRQVAAVLADEGPDSTGLCVLDIAGGKRMYCPLGDLAPVAAPTGSRPAGADGIDLRDHPYWPCWVGEGRLVFLLCHGGRTFLAQWTVGEGKPLILCGLNIPATWAEVNQALAGLGAPLSSDGGRLAYYERASDRIVLVNIADGGRVELPVGTRGGCWLGAGRYIAATAEEALLCTGAANPPTLVPGQWLPRWADETTGRILLCGPGPHARAFKLVRLTLVKGQ